MENNQMTYSIEYLRYGRAGKDGFKVIVAGTDKELVRKEASEAYLVAQDEVWEAEIAKQDNTTVEQEDKAQREEEITENIKKLLIEVPDISVRKVAEKLGISKRKANEYVKDIKKVSQSVAELESNVA